MKKYPFNNNNPFTVPDGYFDTLQERVMSHIEDKQQAAVESRVVRMGYYRVWIAVAACVLFIFTAGVLYIANIDRQPTVAQSIVDDDIFYQWFYASDRTTLLAESLDMTMPEHFAADEEYISEEDEAIISFLERDNINVVAIVHSMNDVNLLNNQ